MICLWQIMLAALNSSICIHSLTKLIADNLFEDLVQCMHQSDRFVLCQILLLLFKDRITFVICKSSGTSLILQKLESMVLQSSLFHYFISYAVSILFHWISFPSWILLFFRISSHWIRSTFPWCIIDSYIVLFFIFLFLLKYFEQDFHILFPEFLCNHFFFWFGNIHALYHFWTIMPIMNTISNFSNCLLNCICLLELRF